jgi:hypothetical protein
MFGNEVTVGFPLVRTWFYLINWSSSDVAPQIKINKLITNSEDCVIRWTTPVSRKKFHQQVGVYEVQRVIVHKVFLFTQWRHIGGEEVQRHSFLTSALAWVEWSTSPRETTSVPVESEAGWSPEHVLTFRLSFRNSTPQHKARNLVYSYIEWLQWLLIVAKESFEHVVKFKYLVTTVTKDECLRNENNHCSTKFCRKNIIFVTRMWYVFAGRDILLFALLNSRSMNSKQMLFSLANTRVIKRTNCLQNNRALSFLNGISRSQQTWGEW